MVTASTAPVRAGDHSPPDERGGNALGASPPARRPEGHHARAGPDARTRNMSVQTGKHSAAPARSAADKRRRHSPRSAQLSSLRSHTGNRRQRVAHLRRQRSEGRGQRRRAAHNDECRVQGSGIAAGAIGLAQTTACTIALNGVLELSAHGESCARRLTGIAPQDKERGTVDASASLKKRLKIGAARQPLRSRESPGYTVSRLRPLARRRLSTFRPPLVFMRSRKPCVFARRRRLG
jgi:hypothetical protein